MNYYRLQRPNNCKWDHFRFGLQRNGLRKVRRKKKWWNGVNISYSCVRGIHQHVMWKHEKMMENAIEQRFKYHFVFCFWWFFLTDFISDIWIYSLIFLNHLVFTFLLGKLLLNFSFSRFQFTSFSRFPCLVHVVQVKIPTIWRGCLWVFWVLPFSTELILIHRILQRRSSQGCIFTAAISAIQNAFEQQRHKLLLSHFIYAYFPTNDKYTFDATFFISFFFLMFVCSLFRLKLLYYRLVARSQRKFLNSFLGILFFLGRVTLLFITFVRFTWCGRF